MATANPYETGSIFISRLLTIVNTLLTTQNVLFELFYLSRL